MLATYRLAPVIFPIKRRPLLIGWTSACVVLILTAVGIAPALATNGTWTNTTSGGLWSTTTNWSGGVVANGTDGIADFSTLNITADDTIHLDTARTIGQLKFGDTTPSNNWILDNNALATNILTLAVSSGSPTITVNNDTATMNLVLAGTQGFTKSGAGELLLNDADTFTGGVAINAGTLALGNSGALGSTSNAISVSGGTLDLGGQAIGANPLTIFGTGVGGNGALINSSASPASFAGTITATGPFNVGGTGDITLSGSVDSSNQLLTKIGNNTLTLSGTTDNNSLAVTVDSGTVVLAKTSGGGAHAIGQDFLTVNGGTAQLGGTGGDQIFDLGSVSVTSGTFDANGRNETFLSLFLQGTGIGGNGALVNSAAGPSVITPTGGTTLTANTTIGVLQATGNLTLNSAISGAFAITKVGPGTLTLPAANTFTGSVTVSAGTLALGNTNALGSTANAVSVSNGATLDLGGQTIGANPLTLTANGVGNNGALINSSSNPASYAGTVTLNSPTIIGGNGQITLSGSVASSTILAKNGGNTLILSGTTDNTGLQVEVNSGTVILAKTSSSSVHAVGSLGLTVSGGTAQLGGIGGDQVNDSAFVLVNSGAFDLNGQTETIAGLDLQGTGIGGAGALVNSSATSGSTLNVTGGITLTGNATIGVTQSTGEMSLGTSAVGGNFALTKTGPGTLDIETSNTFSGGLVVAQGTLRTSVLPLNNAGTAGLFGNNTSVTLGSNGQTGTLQYLTGTNSTTNMPFTLAAGGTGAFDIQRVCTLTSPVSGAGSLLVTGGGALDLKGNNTFTGAVTISNGSALNVFGTNAFTGGVTINDSSELGVATGGDLNASTPNPVVFGPGSNGTLLLGTSVTITGLDSIATNVNSPPSVQASSGTPANLTVNISGSSNSSFAGNLMDGTVGGFLSLTKSGSGTLTLSGNNTYTGTTTINGGTLKLNGDIFPNNVGMLGSITLVNDLASTTVVNNGVLEFDIPSLPASSNTQYAYGGNMSGTGSLTKGGAGSLLLFGNNTYTGATTISGGTLIVQSGSLASDIVNQANFIFDGGTIGGRLTNQGTATFNADFSSANGMENDGVAIAAAGVNLTFNGAGLDNEGTLTTSGGAINLGGASNVNRGNLSVSTVNLAGAALANQGSLTLNGGAILGTTGLLTNNPGGTISGTGMISAGFSNNGGSLVVGSGTINVTQSFTNNGIIQLNSFTSSLGGGAITNNRTINGNGSIGNAVTNNGTIAPLGGSLYLSGAVSNSATGLIRVSAGNEALVTAGLPTNAGIINLIGGTFDNDGFALNNTGQISGYGNFATGGTGLDNNGSITFSGGLTTMNGPVTNENGQTIVVAYNPAIFTGLVTNNGGGTFNIISTTAVFAGGSSGSFSGTFTNNANSAFAVGGSGVLEVDGAPSLGAASSMAIGGTSTLRFKPTTGDASVGAGATATVASGATLELAGSVSSLSSPSTGSGQAGANRVNITNNSSSPGILVSGTNQQVGNIDGAGTTQVNAGSDLTANHIIQSALVIGGTAGSFGTVTIDASDASGNPLAQPGAGGLAASFTTRGAGDGGGLVTLEDVGFSGDPIPAGPFAEGAVVGGNPQALSTGSGQAVPEPSTLWLALLALCGLGVFLNAQRIPRRWIIWCFVAGCALAAGQTALAVNGTWIDTTSGGLWSATTNWSGGIVANGTDGIADFSTLDITADNTVHLDSGRTIGQLKFGDTNPSNNWILDNNGNSFNLLTLAVSSGTPAITVNNDTATLNLELLGTQGFAKNGAGVLLLNDLNNFSGGVTVNAGTLALGNSSAVAANAVTVGFGATLDLGGQAIGTNALTIQGQGVGNNGALINSSASPASFAGTITASFGFGVGGSGNITLNGSVNSGTSFLDSLTKIGGNTLTLSGSTDNSNLPLTVDNGTVVLAKASSNTVHAVGSNGLTVNGGIAQLGGTGGDQINDAAAVTVTSGAFDTNGQNETFASLSLQGTGIGTVGALLDSAGVSSTITPTGGTTLTGDATIGVSQTAGHLLLNNAVGGSFALTKTGLGTLELEASNSFSGGLTVQQGTLLTFQALNNAGTNGVLGNNTSVTLGSSGQTGTLQSAAANGSSNMPFTLAAGGTGAFNVAASSTLQLSGTIGGAGALFVTGGGTFTLSGNNTFTGGATIDTGTTLLIGDSGALNSTAPNIMTDNGTLTLNGNSVTVANLTGSGTVQNANSTTATLTVNVSGALNESFSGTIQDGSGGTLSLVKTGTGTLSIGGTFIAGQTITYTGTTTISGGTLRVKTAGFDPNPSNNVGTAFTSAAIVDNGVLEFNVDFVPPQLAINLAAYLGNISGSGSLTKSGGGTLLLAGNNTYTGTTTITGGTLELLLGSLSSNVVNQATFEFDGGTFSGRLINLGTAKFDTDFIPGNGMENDGTVTVAAGVNLTFLGAGLDNEGTLTAGGTITLNGTSNVNRGTLNPAVLIVTGATLANNGSLALAGGSISGASGLLTNGPGGVISGTGTISTGFVNAGGVIALSGGSMNISQPFTNSGLIAMTGITTNLAGGAITNSGTIQGFGSIGNSINNIGSIEPMGGTLFLGGTLINPAGGLIRVDTGGKLLAANGVLASAGIVYLNGGTFDNGGQPFNNLGQISGYGVFAAGGTGLDNNGSITFSGGLTTVNGPVTNENGKTIVVAYNPAIFTGLVTNNGGGTFNIISTTAVFAGGSSGSFSGTFTKNASSAFAVGGSGVLEVDGAPSLGAASSMAVGGTSTLRFKPTTGAASVGAGVTATVASGATLELAGSVSSLSSPSTGSGQAGGNRVNVVNNSAAPGILVSGTKQQVGNIDGSGTTQVNAGGDLTANHVIQGALVIGGTAGSFGAVTIVASDASGNPLDQSPELAVPGSVQASGPFAAGVGSPADLTGVASTNPESLSVGNTTSQSLSPVPEPSTLVLVLLAISSVLCRQIAMNRRTCGPEPAAALPR